MHFIALITDFGEGDDDALNQLGLMLKLVVFKILASDVLPIRDLSLSGASNKSNEYMGAYSLSE